MSIDDVKQLKHEKVVWTEVQNLPMSPGDEAYISTDMVIALCQCGESRSYYDMRPVCFRRHDVSVMLPDHIVSKFEGSADYNALLVIISQEFYNEFIHHDSFRNFYKYRYRPCFSLSDEQYEKLFSILNALKVAVTSRHSKRLSMVANILDVFFYELNSYRGDDDGYTGHRHLFQQFYDLLVDNYNKHHDVVWYADRLNLTPKYFSIAIREATGISAGEWIANVLSLKAKSLIQTRYDLNIQEIGTLMGFVNITSFCRFFRRMNGMSPKKFRES